MTRIDMGIDARYRHTSGAVAIVTCHEGGGPSNTETVELRAFEDPRPFPGQPFTIDEPVESVVVRRDPTGGFTADNAKVIEMPGRPSARPLRVTRAKFDAEWTRA